MVGCWVNLSSFICCLEDLVIRISFWTSGICPEFVDTSHWKLNLGGGDVTWQGKGAWSNDLGKSLAYTNPLIGQKNWSVACCGCSFPRFHFSLSGARYQLHCQMKVYRLDFGCVRHRFHETAVSRSPVVTSWGTAGSSLADTTQCGSKPCDAATLLNIGALCWCHSTEGMRPSELLQEDLLNTNDWNIYYRGKSMWALASLEWFMCRTRLCLFGIRSYSLLMLPRRGNASQPLLGQLSADSLAEKCPSSNPFSLLPFLARWPFHSTLSHFFHLPCWSGLHGWANGIDALGASCSILHSWRIFFAPGSIPLWIWCGLPAAQT